MSKIIKLEKGERFGRLTVIEDLGMIKKEGSKRKTHYIRCVCDCKNETIVSFNHLRSGHTTSCGCWMEESKLIRNRKYNEYCVFEDTVFVKFSNSEKYFICDLDDWKELKEYCWSESSKGYAISYKNSKNIWFHRVVTKCPDDMVVDHCYQVSNGVCDNRKENLRICTNKQNSRNMVNFKTNKTGYKGIIQRNGSDKWESHITVDYKSIYLGSYENIEDAIKARREAEIKYGFKHN